MSTSKARAEQFYLIYSIIWIAMVTRIVLTEAYEQFDSLGYLYFGALIGLPPMIYPFLFPLGDDRKLHWTQRFSTKSTAWIWIFSFIGNYFWTHYFYNLLGASYTFDSWRLNDVPFCLYLITHSYFCTYFTLADIVIRRSLRLFNDDKSMTFGVILILSYVVAFTETFTIQHFPYYTFKDRSAMYLVGSGFYAIYFIVGFPMYYRLDDTWTLSQCVLDSFASCMIVTLLLDFWKLTVGAIV